MSSARLSCEHRVDSIFSEEGGTEDDVCGTKRKDLVRPFGRSDPATDATGKLTADARDELRVLSDAFGSIEIDQLDLRPALAARDPFVDASVARASFSPCMSWTIRPP